MKAVYCVGGKFSQWREPHLAVGDLPEIMGFIFCADRDEIIASAIVVEIGSWAFTRREGELIASLVVVIFHVVVFWFVINDFLLKSWRIRFWGNSDAPGVRPYVGFVGFVRLPVGTHPRCVRISRCVRVPGARRGSS